MTDFTDPDPPAEAVEELLRALKAEFPDPLDVFEDELADGSDSCGIRVALSTSGDGCPCG